jgi:hypothetical protein
MCPACDPKLECPVWSSVASVIGAWARERRRQGTDLLGPVNKEEMAKAVGEKVDKMVEAKCQCPCHDKKR